MQSARLLLLSGIISTSACSATDVQPVSDPVPYPDKAAAANEYCDGIDKLVAAHEDGFKSMRGRRNATKLMDIWQTDFHLVGNSCEIWGWGSGKVNYMCSKTLPNKEVATERYDAAKQIVEACLPDWTLQESPRKLGEGMKALYQKDGQLPGVAIHVVATKALFKTEWSAYVFVGDPEDQL